MNFTDLDSLSDTEIKTLYQGILAMRQTTAGRQMIDRCIAEIRSGKLKQPGARPIQVPAGFVDESDPTTFSGDTD